ncbi:MAG: phosphoribosylaminoimidazolesuccinocarboxamide synthase [Candidatus Delongbacteria bacterium]|nr:phosphoribosylaminoimidazolesuccinocarboxamide synthase [Candidatus Delongbacteria bacterium]
MVTENNLLEQLKQTLNPERLQLPGDYYQGKVRDNYSSSSERLILVSDRVSAFDRVITTIPFKGQVLNQLAAWWFEQTGDIVENHLISLPDPNVMKVRECEPVLMEMIVRGYLTGVTNTSAWFNYDQGVRDFAGNRLPEGMRKDQRFEQPLLTPSTKAPQGEHDETVAPAVLLERGIVSETELLELSNISLRLYERGREITARQGIILVDTKYEFGRVEGKLVLMDEIHTPDSSRFWFADEYVERFRSGRSQKKIDKEYLREWLVEQGFRGEGEVPSIPDGVRLEAARRYIAAFELITGSEFMAVPGDPLPRLRKNLGI